MKSSKKRMQKMIVRNKKLCAEEGHPAGEVETINDSGVSWKHCVRCGARYAITDYNGAI